MLYKSKEKFDKFFAAISKKLTIVDKGEISNCLNMSINHKGDTLKIDQEKYINEILNQFELFNLQTS